MKKKLLIPAWIAVVGLIAAVASLAIAADSNRDRKAAGQQQPQLPHGMTEEQLKDMIAAGTPGKMHERLLNDVGEWQAKTTMWMTPDAEPLTSDGTCTVAAMMDGRYIKSEMKGEMPGMGPYHGFGISGYDNVAQKFVSNWIDNHSTGIMQGEGELSDDGKMLTWNFTANCPITKKPVAMREVDTITGPNTKTLEMFGTDLASGKEFKMMSIELTKK